MVQASTNRDASPPHPEGSFERAFDTHLKDALDGAVAGYQEVVAAQSTAAQSTHVDAWGNLCIALCNLGRAEEAAEAGRRALALRPDIAALNINLAAALKVLGQFGDAARAGAGDCA